GMGGPIHELDTQFNKMHSFGSGYTSENEVLNSSLSRTSLRCDTANNRLVSAGSSEIYIFDSTGEVKRIINWQDYTRLVATADADGFSTRLSEGGLNRLRTLGFIDDGLLLAQYDWVSSED